MSCRRADRDLIDREILSWSVASVPVLMAGTYLGRWAKKFWDGEPDELLMVELHRAGSLPKARIRGIQTRDRGILGGQPRCDAEVRDGQLRRVPGRTQFFVLLRQILNQQTVVVV